MNDFSGTDYLIGAVVWVLAMIFGVNSMACLKLDNCNGGDMFLFGVIAIGMLGPAYAAMLTFTGMFKK